MNDVSADKDHELVALLEQACHAVLATRERELAGTGITGVQATVLSTIKAIGYRATPAEVSRRVLRESQSVSSILVRMEGAGLIIRVKDLQRKNMVRLAMTKKGEQAYRESLGRESSRKLLTPLSEIERGQLREYLEKLRNRALALNRAPDRPPFP